MSKFYVPAWVSRNIYEEDNEKIIYLINEKTHECIVLDGLSALLWCAIENNLNLDKFSFDNDCADEFDEFIEELCSIGLIVKNGNVEQNSVTILPQRFDLQTFSDFIQERDSLILKNGGLPSLFLELTYNCNQNCIHCYSVKANSEIKFNDLKHVIDEAYNLCTPLIKISGGECTLNSDFLKIISYIREKRMSFEFYTNGQYMYDNPAFFDKIISLYPYRISLSLYSMNPDIHDKVTGVKGSHSKTIAIIKKLKELNILVNIKCFLMKNNAKEYLEIQKFAKEIDVGVSLDCKFTNNPVKCNSCVKITDQQMFDLYTDKNSLLYIEDELHPDLTDKNFLERRVCTSDCSGLTVSADYNIYACPAIKIPLGNIKTHSLIDIWKNRNVDSPLQKIRNIKIKDLKDCFKHDYCKHCLYCLGEAITNDKFLKPYSKFCDDAKVRMNAYNANMRK